METISLKMEQGLLKDIDTTIQRNRYSTRTEFIRESIRNKLNELEKQEVIRKLVEFKGSLNGKAKRNDKEAGEIAIKKIAKKLNISLD